MSQTKFVIISPMKNEEAYVSKTIEAVVSQTVRPLKWVIVNDGSSDRSPAIVSDARDKHQWISVLNLQGLGDRQPEHYGAHVVDVFYAGLKSVAAVNYDFIVKLDCDVSVAPNFFETIFTQFERSPKLGISSGVSFVQVDGKLVEEKSAPDHTLGATKVYRKCCFDEIGGLVPFMGWDGIDEIKARMKGWQARPIRNLVVVHHRPEGEATGLFSSGIERGKGSYFMGYHPIYMLARAVSKMIRVRPFLDGIGMLAGYFGALLRQSDQIPDPDFVRHLRRNQLRKLLLLRNEI